jgi:phosphate starvation-inducible PhoH-like protein
LIDHDLAELFDSTKPSRRKTRKVKITEGTTSKISKEKFQEERQAKAIPIEAKTNNQKKYLELLKTHKVIFALGSSGSGKTWCAAVHGGNEFLRGMYEKIILLRPVEPVGKTLGFRPGDSQMKLYESYQSMYEPLREVFGDTHFDYLIEKGKIIPEATEFCRGRSYKNSYIILDEASNCDIKTIKTLVSRLGEGSKLVVCGDQATWQQDIKGESGLTWLIDTINKTRKDNPAWMNTEDKDNLYNQIGVVKFTKDDCVRSGISALFVKMFDDYE